MGGELLLQIRPAARPEVVKEFRSSLTSDLEIALMGTSRRLLRIIYWGSVILDSAPSPYALQKPFWRTLSHHRHHTNLLAFPG